MIKITLSVVMIAVALGLAYKGATVKNDKVANVFGRTLPPCPPRCVVIDKRIALTTDGVFLHPARN